MISDNKKEVFFELYCSKCKNAETKETEDPCNECLDFPYNINSHKPVYFKEKDDADRG